MANDMAPGRGFAALQRPQDRNQDRDRLRPRAHHHGGDIGERVPCFRQGGPRFQSLRQANGNAEKARCAGSRLPLSALERARIRAELAIRRFSIGQRRDWRRWRKPSKKLRRHSMKPENKRKVEEIATELDDLQEGLREGRRSGRNRSRITKEVLDPSGLKLLTDFEDCKALRPRPETATADACRRRVEALDAGASQRQQAAGAARTGCGNGSGKGVCRSQAGHVRPRRRDQEQRCA